MVYITGDIHGTPTRIYEFAQRHQLTKNDVVILLGDVGANYYGDERDERVKETLSNVKAQVLCIHGNHEMRPWEANGYVLTDWNGGKVWVQEEYPNLLFAKDGEIFAIEGKRYIAIGGAYSVDSYWRIQRHAGWWKTEQPTEEIKRFVEKQLQENEIDIILSHTCPRKYEPIEAFLAFIDQSTVDTSTEDWLDSIEEKTGYEAWYCGHWHIEKDIDKMHFLFKTWRVISCPEWHLLL